MPAKMFNLPLSHKRTVFPRWIVLSIAGLANFLDLCQSSMVLPGLQDIIRATSMNFTPNTTRIGTKSQFIPKEILRSSRIMTPIAIFMFTGGGW